MREIKDRRSIRKYLPKQVEPEKLNALIEAARLAPSGSNCQDWHFVLVQSEEGRQKVLDAGVNQPWMSSAPVFIICVAGLDKRAPELCDLKLTAELPHPALKMAIRDLTIAIEHIVLEAEYLGLGSCWVGSIDRDKLHASLGIPENKYILAALTIGYPDESPAPRPRKAMEEILHLEKW